jgi:hypothetical protein
VFDPLLKSAGRGCTTSATLLVIAFIFSLAMALDSGPEYLSALPALLCRTICVIASLAIWQQSSQLPTRSFAVIATN